MTLDFLPLPLPGLGGAALEVRIVAWEVFGFVAIMTTSFRAGVRSVSTTRAGSSPLPAWEPWLQVYILAAAVMTCRWRSPPSSAGRRAPLPAQLHRVGRGMLLLRSRRGTTSRSSTSTTRPRACRTATDVLGRRLDEVLATAEPLDLVAARLLAGDITGWTSQVGVHGRTGARSGRHLVAVDRPHPTLRRPAARRDRRGPSPSLDKAAERLTSATLDTTAAMILVTDLRRGGPRERLQ